jgi:hypothetical protein
MSRRGCSLPANASGLDSHRASIRRRLGQVGDTVLGVPSQCCVVKHVLRAAHAYNLRVHSDHSDRQQN